MGAPLAPLYFGAFGLMLLLILVLSVGLVGVYYWGRRS